VVIKWNFATMSGLDPINVTLSEKFMVARP